MTDAELDAMTAPDYFADAPPMFSNLGGLSLSQVERPRVRPRCGYCSNHGAIPVANPDCNRPIHRRVNAGASWE